METERLRFPDPAELRQCLFIRAFEEADPAGERLPMADRGAASKTALPEEGLNFIRTRTRILGSRLKGPAAEGFSAVAKTGSPLPAYLIPGVAAVAFLIGWATHGLGPDGRVSLLAFPLLGLIVWNLVVVTVSLLAGLRKKKPPLRLPARLQSRPRPTGDPLTDRVVARTLEEWQESEAAVLAAKARQIFHIAALMLAAGVVAGMYAGGLVKNYQAGWESTFLTQPEVSRFSRIVLGPASILTGVPVPAVPPQGGLSPAAPWIHLWAATAGLFILVPRLLLISMTWRQVRGAGRNWTQEFADYEATARRLAGGQPLVARVLPVQIEPDSKLRDSLRALLQYLWGGQVMVDFLPSVPYGGEDEAMAILPEPPTHLVLLFPLAVTPEDEVHGELHRNLERFLQGAAVPPFALTILDAATFESRLAGMPEAARRIHERRAAWEKILGPSWPLLVWDAAARRQPSVAAASVADARQPLRPWTADA